MSKNSDIVWVRIGGRPVPIKKKKVDGVAKVTTAAAVSVASGMYAADKIKRASFSYSRSANLRGASKLIMGKGRVYRETIRNAAAFKIAGQKFARKGFGALALGAAVATTLATSGSKKLTNDDKKVVSTTAAVTALGLAAFSFNSKLGSMVRLAKKINPKNPVAGIAGLYKSQGTKKTADTIKKYAKSSYKGFTPKPSTIYDAKQLTLIDTPKKFDVAKWLKGKM